MRKLLIYLKDYKKESILGPLFKLLEASFELIVPLVVASMIDVGIPAQDKGYIVKMALVLVALGIIGLTSSVTAQFFAAKAAVGFATKVRHALFEHIQKLTFGQMDSQGTATLITRMTSDVNQVQNGVNLVLRLALHCIWCHDYGIYRRCKGSVDFCSGDSVIAHSRICHSVNQHSDVWTGAGKPRSGHAHHT